MIIKEQTREEEGTLEIRIIPMPNAFLIQINSDIVRGTLIMDHSLEKENLDEVITTIFNLIDEVSMGSLPDENEIPQ